MLYKLRLCAHAHPDLKRYTDGNAHANGNTNSDLDQYADSDPYPVQHAHSNADGKFLLFRAALDGM